MRTRRRRRSPSRRGRVAGPNGGPQPRCTTVVGQYFRPMRMEIVDAAQTIRQTPSSPTTPVAAAASFLERERFGRDHHSARIPPLLLDTNGINERPPPDTLFRAGMAFLFNKFQEAVRTLAKNPMFARDPRHLQFEADVNRLFLYTSYYRLGVNAEEKDAEEIIDLASKASVDQQQKQVQENVHYQLRHICQAIDSFLRPDATNEPSKDLSEGDHHSRRSGLSFAVGGVGSANKQAVPSTKPLTRAELSKKFKDQFGYTLDIRQSGIPHKDAGQGLFLSGEANVGAVLAIYPGVIYSPAYYRYIPGYPRIDACNNYLITRYDGTIINAKPWCFGGETRELWDGSDPVDYSAMTPKGSESNSDRVWRMLSKPLKESFRENFGEVLERRNPLAFGHFANHPPQGSAPNVMICPYDFPLTEKDMRVYIPNITFGGEEPITMKRFGSFYFKSGGSGNQAGGFQVLKTLALVSTRSICDEELFLNYRYSNSKRRPEWYTPVDEEEDKRRWS